MHIEPGVVSSTKIILSYATAASAFGLAGKLALDSIRQHGGVGRLLARSVITTALVLGFFQFLPHHPVGVSEVHLILGSTLLLIFGAGAAAIGLAAGLLMQGMVFAPADLPQYGMNVTTVLVPLWGISHLANRIVPVGTAYVDLDYRQALSLSMAYQGGIVAWVAFWVLYGQGFGAATVASIGTFGLAYMSVVLIEPVIDLAVLAGAKAGNRLTTGPLFNVRLHQQA
jgi:hypothetical protein